MLEVFLFTAYLLCGFQQTVGIPKDTNYAPLLADLFLYSYEADAYRDFSRKNEKKLAVSFNFMFRYIDIRRCPVTN